VTTFTSGKVYIVEFWDAMKRVSGRFSSNCNERKAAQPMHPASPKSTKVPTVSKSREPLVARFTGRLAPPAICWIAQFEQLICPDDRSAVV